VCRKEDAACWFGDACADWNVVVFEMGVLWFVVWGLEIRRVRKEIW
jgi:hypothetical protein